MAQISMFDGSQKFKIDKPIRLIELFGGYGSQALALKYLGIPFEHYLLSEWAVKSIQAYKDLHFENDNTDYSKVKKLSEIKEWLSGRISSDYSTALSDKQIERWSEKETRKIYNNMKACNNLGSIAKIKGSELNIVDVDKFTYILTYSFPCQDLSLAGKGLGMEKGSNTRSGLLWEVERLLKKTENLPQVLLMENVPEVIGTKNIKHFAKWVEFLDGLGYKSYYRLLNAKDFGIPQNRNRCFMVSVLGDYYYNMPKTMPLKYCLRDFLDKEVDDKYYLSEKAIIGYNAHKQRNEAKGNSFGWKTTTGGGVGRTITTKVDRAQGNFILYNGEKEMNNGCKQIAQLKKKGLESNNRVYSVDYSSPTITTCGGGNTEPKIMVYDDFNRRIRADQNTVGCLTTNCGNDAPRNGTKLIEPNYRVRKLTENECGKLMGVKPCDIKKIGKNLSKSAMYHCFGDSIVVPVLMAIFGEMTDINYQEKIKEVVKEILKSKGE